MFHRRLRSHTQILKLAVCMKNSKTYQVNLRSILMYVLLADRNKQLQTSYLN